MLRLIREEFTKEYRGVVIDDRALYEETRGYVEAIAPELAERVEFYDAEEEGLPLFERFHISEQLLKALDRKVWLPSGGSLIIERTEALTVIDVNTGKNVGKSNLEETVFRNNLEAAEEVARQLRLRDIGGIIVIDFVDMEIKNNRDETMRVFRDALARDKTRTQVFEMSELGPGRDDPQADLGGSGRVVQRHLPDLPGPGVRPRRGPAAVDGLASTGSAPLFEGFPAPCTQSSAPAASSTGSKPVSSSRSSGSASTTAGGRARPVLVVDGETVLATPAQLDGAVVKARVVGAIRGPKIDGFTYKPKSNNRRRYGHRQDLSVIEILGITPAGAKK